MSIPLPTVNLAGVSVNQSGTVSFANVGVSAGGVSANPANIQNAGTILVFNESGSGLLIVFQTSQSGFYLPAGAWMPAPIKAGETGYTWTVLYNLPNPPVTMLLTTYYYPGEAIPPQPTLGNSPIGIGGTVSTSSVQTLSNESNSSITLVIDIGQTGNTQLITINSDGSASWSVLQAGTQHTIFAINNTGTPLQLGKSGDVTEVLGQLNVDTKISLDNGRLVTDGFGDLAFNNAKTVQWKDTGATIQNVLTLDNANNFGITIPSTSSLGRAYIVDKNGGQIVFFDAGGIHLNEGMLSLLVGSISRISLFTGVGTGTYNHGLGTTPDFVIPICTANGSQTMGYDSVTSTQVHITCGAGLSFAALAIKF